MIYWHGPLILRRSIYHHDRLLSYRVSSSKIWSRSLSRNVLPKIKKIGQQFHFKNSPFFGNHFFFQNSYLENEDIYASNTDGKRKRNREETEMETPPTMPREGERESSPTVSRLFFFIALTFLHWIFWYTGGGKYCMWKQITLLLKKLKPESLPIWIFFAKFSHGPNSINILRLLNKKIYSILLNKKII